MLTDMRRLKNVINGIGWENMTEADQASLALAGFVNPAIEAATGINPDLSHSKTVELWQDPTYVPPFQCSSPCRRNQKDQKDNNQKCPESAATPDPGVQQTPEEAARWKRNRRKRTKSGSGCCRRKSGSGDFLDHTRASRVEPTFRGDGLSCARRAP